MLIISISLFLLGANMNNLMTKPNLKSNFTIKSKLLLNILILLLIFTVGCNKHEPTEKETNTNLTVAVSIVPVAGFVEAIAGDLANVITVVPPGNSPANYQPTALEMQLISDADIYYALQIPTEEANILPEIYDFNKDLYIVNLREKIQDYYPLRFINKHSDENDQTVDPHIWLSPKRVIVMVQSIADSLSELDPLNETTYQKNVDKYIQKLQELDQSIKKVVNSMDNKAFMIYHGAYGYFADDYELQMIAIEADGKAATPSKIKEVIDTAKENNINTIFFQEEFSDTQANSIAPEIHGKVIKTSPLSKDYIENLMDFVNALENSGE